jgi:hypothetical protein
MPAWQLELLQQQWNAPEICFIPTTGCKACRRLFGHQLDNHRPVLLAKLAKA